MHHHRKILVFCFSFLFLIQMMSGFNGQPKRELRAVWIATVMNIDWPSQPGLSAHEQKKQIDALLNEQKALGMNVIILQVRSVSDAIYPSRLAPWAKCLSGKQGLAPEPFYDPLEYYIEACHARGMELHAWFNPFRVKLNPNDVLAPDHILHQHPEWAWEYNNRSYMDPGIPEVRDHLKSVVLEVVHNYDIDAVHFDDYFYPYPAKDESLPDDASFASYGAKFNAHEVDDWRRENINQFIKDLGLAIKDEKPWVKFGISPFGVWRNLDNDARGSQTQAGITNYDHLYADVRRWQEEGWIDYLMPQIYWSRGHPTADFITLVDWWNENSFSRGLYIGHGLYRVNENPRKEAWNNRQEIPDQVRLIREKKNVKGSAWFSSHQFNQEKIGLKEVFKEDLYNKKALVPKMPWIDSLPPLPPINLKVQRVRKEGRFLTWDVEEDEDEMNKARFFVVYRLPEGDTFDPRKSENILDITGTNDYFIKSRFFLAKKEKWTYYISTLDRLNNESEVSDPINIKQ